MPVECFNRDTSMDYPSIIITLTVRRRASVFSGEDMVSKTALKTICTCRHLPTYLAEVHSPMGANGPHLDIP